MLGTKHPGFAEEQEWRILVNLLSNDIANVRYRQGRATLVPYVEVDVSDVNTSQLPILEIIQGPTLHPQLARKALDAFLKKNGLTNVLITDSEIPLRT
jgi:hypothetical protein